MSKTIVTQEHLDRWPHLADEGVEVGHEIELPTEDSADATSEEQPEVKDEDALVAGEGNAEDEVDEGAHLADDEDDENQD